MKDFDAQRLAGAPAEDERTFKVGGETLVFRASVPADPLALYFSALGKPYVELLPVTDALMEAMLAPGYEEAWRRARSAELEMPLSVENILDLVDEVLEVVVARPTVKPSDSSTSPEPTGTSSMAPSPSSEASTSEA